MDSQYTEFYTVIQSKLTKRKRNSNLLILALIPFFILLVLYPFLSRIFATLPSEISLVTQVLYYAYIVLFLYGIFSNLNQMTKLNPTLKENLFYELYNIQVGLGKFLSDRTVTEHLNKISTSLRNVAWIADLYSSKGDTGFANDKLLVESLNMLHQNIPKYGKDLEAPSQDTILKYSGLVMNLIHAVYNDDIEKLQKLLKHDYVPQKNKLEEFMRKTKSSISSSLVTEYLISFGAALAVSYVFVTVFQLPLWTDLSSALAALVAFFAIVAGIKKIVIDKIKSVFEER